MVQAHRLIKSPDDRVLFGVAGGLSEYFGIDPVLVRVGLVVAAVVSGGIVALIYLLLAFVMPDQYSPTASYSPEDDSAGEEPGVEHVRTPGHRTRNVFAAGLIVAGLVMLLINLGVLGAIRWDIVWPVVIIALGLTILIPSIRR